MTWNLFPRRAVSAPLPAKWQTLARPRAMLDPAERELALHHPKGEIVMVDDVDVEFARSTLMTTAMRVRDALVASLMNEPRDREAHRRLLANFHACGAAIEKIDAEAPRAAALPRATALGDVLAAAGPPLSEDDAPSAAITAAIEAAVAT